MKTLLGFCVSMAAALVVVAPSGAAVTYHFEQSAGAGDTRFGLFSGGTGPVQFDFTVAQALAANTSYSFGFSPISKGTDGSVLSFAVNGGNAYSNFASSDFPAKLTVYGGGRNTDARIGVQTDATGAIAFYDILITGISAASSSEFLTVQIQHTSPIQGVAVVEGLYNLNHGASAALQCVVGCGGGFTVAGSTVAPSVPEPATWAMLVAGFGMIGSSLRYGRKAPRRLA